MRGIILAGGNGSRLRPLTNGLAKSLLPVYDKPMFYYPLSTLMLMGISEILIIVAPNMLPIFKSHFGTGGDLGIRIEYTVQTSPKGLPDAFVLGSKFIGSDCITLILGDNLLYGTGMGRNLKGITDVNGAVITTSQVSNPEDYGVIEFDEKNNIKSLVEKPQNSSSNWAIPGLYCFDNSVSERALSLSPSARGELEIIELLQSYLKENRLSYLKLERGTAWLDMGNPKALIEASNFVKTIQDRQGLIIGDPFEIAWRNSWISQSQYEKFSNLEKYKARLENSD